MLLSDLIECGYWLVPWSRKPRKPLCVDWLHKKPDASGFSRAYGDTIDWAIIPIETVVLDLERKNGLDGLADLQEFGVVTPGAITQTKSGGFHYWFRQPAGRRLVGGHHIRPGIEAKAVNGSVHIPPSAGYAPIMDLNRPELLPELPPRLVDAWLASAKTQSPHAGSYMAEAYPPGERRSRLCSMAGKLRSVGLVEPELFAALVGIRDNRCVGDDAPTDDDLRRIAKDYGQKPERSDGIRELPDTSWFPEH